MDFLLARVADRRNWYRKMIAGETIYQIPSNLENRIRYTPMDICDEDSWFYIDSFSQNKFCLDILKQDVFNSTDYEEINVIQPEKISYLVSYQGQNFFCFQRVYTSSLLQQKRFLHIGGRVEVRECERGIIINDVPDAIYSKREDCLYFKKLETITPIFKGIDELYREATEEETRQFLGYSFINLQNGFDTLEVKKSNRKRIALAMNVLGSFSEKQKRRIFEYTNEYFPNLKYNGNSFEIENEEDLKNLLYGIEQRLYTTPVTKEQRCASAVRNIGT